MGIFGLFKKKDSEKTERIAPTFGTDANSKKGEKEGIVGTREKIGKTEGGAATAAETAGEAKKANMTGVTDAEISKTTVDAENTEIDIDKEDEKDDPRDKKFVYIGTAAPLTQEELDAIDKEVEEDMKNMK